MADDTWKAPQGDDAARSRGSARPAGNLSDPLDVARRFFADVGDNVGGYIGLTVVQLVVLFLAIGVFVVLGGLAFLPGIMLESELLTFLGLGAFILLCVPMLTVPSALMTASMLRGLDAQERGGPKIGAMTSLTGITQDAGRILAFYLLYSVMAIVGMMMCYLPGLVASTVGMFAMPMVVLEGAGAFEAMGRSWRHTRENVEWHVPVWIVLYVLIVVTQFTVVGLLAWFPLIVGYQYFAYRVAFGDSGSGAPEIA